MRGRLTLEKVNIAINEMATYAEATALLVGCPKKKASPFTTTFSAFGLMIDTLCIESSTFFPCS